MKTIKPIETRYAGCRFRSRTEARWAVFFDHFGLRWEYEKEGFDLTEASRDEGVKIGRYLPDFYLPEIETWVEIKGCLPQVHFHQTPEELAIELVVRESNAWAGFVLFGPPDPDVPAFYYGPPGRPGDDCPFEGRRVHQAWCEFETLKRWVPNDSRIFLSGVSSKAISAAKSARFEFGEKGGR